MGLRKEIESLAVWFVVASFIVFIVNILATNSGVSNLKNMLHASGDPVAFMAFFSSLGVFIKFIDNLAVSMWLFRRSTLSGYNRWLWAVFGLAGSLVGGALYLLAIAYEASPSNKSINCAPSAPDAQKRAGY